MAFQPTENGASATLRWVWGGESWANVLWFSKTAFSEPDQLILANIIMDAFLAANRDGWPIQIQLFQVEVTDGRTQGAPLVTSTRDAVGGGAGTNPMPLNVTCLLTLRTALRGRSYRGRVYFSGLAEEVHGDNAWQSIGVGSVLSFADQLADDTAAAAWTWSVRSGQINGVKRAEAILVPVLSHEVRSTRVTTQRRRVNRP